jgi:hypothetical protein
MELKRITEFLNPVHRVEAPGHPNLDHVGPEGSEL